MFRSLLDRYPFELKYLPDPSPLPRLQSHRGYRTTGAIENTLHALKEASRVGYEMVEFDLRLSKDSVPVLHHDESLLRIYSDPCLISDLTAKELQDYGVTTLAEVFESSQVPFYFNIEFKNPSFFDFRLEKATLDLIQDFKLEERCMFSSFNPMSCLYTSLNQPKGRRPMRSAFLVCEIEDPDNPLWGQWALMMPLAQPHLLHLGHHRLTQERMQEFKRKNWTVNVWTVNEIEKARQLINWGASSIITDHILPEQL